MQLFNIIALLLLLTAAFGYVNHRFIRLPTTIGTLLVSIAFSVFIVMVGHLTGAVTGIETRWMGLVRSIDFNETLLVGMLGFLLFAGALHVDFHELRNWKWEVLVLATGSTILSAALIGSAVYGAARWFAFPLDYVHCLLFGALIAPTDPIAVLGIMRTSGVPKGLEVLISGESLFNDGVGVVLFITLLSVAGGESSSLSDAALLFLREFLGGAIFGLVLGWAAYLVLKSIDNYHVEIMITLALVTGGYSLAAALHTSGPITMVVAGLVIGNHGRRFAMSEQTRRNIDTFWELVDQILNSLLFVLIGLEVLVVPLTWPFIAAGLLAIVAALAGRFGSIGLPLLLLPARRFFNGRILRLMTWGGLRGGISVALALSLPHGPERDITVTMTYTVVVFSILVQGLSIRPLAEKARRSGAFRSFRSLI
jgi:CPA1 family monovalent cation:H+ antiporter